MLRARIWLTLLMGLSVFGLCLIGAGVFVEYRVGYRAQLVQTPPTGQAPLPMTQITIKTQANNAAPIVLNVELATTPTEQVAGLSGRASLEAGTGTQKTQQGMLFVFDSPSTTGFWMKDMRFALDIIFANSDGKIITIYQNISPDTYPEQFVPTAPATYVLEVPAGFAQAHALAVGDTFEIGK